MRRLVLAAALLTAIVTALPAAAITNGTVDGDRHPNVGGLLSPTQYSDGTWVDCSGTLISPTVFLTAAHCGTDGNRVDVSFATAYHAGDTVYAGTFQADPQYSQRQNNPHDIAVVVLSKPVTGINPAALPKAGSLAHLSKDQTFTSVGYGAYKVTRGPGGHRYLYNDVRMMATGTLNAVNKSWLRISMNPATGTAAPATATPADRTSSVIPTSWRLPRSPATRYAEPPTSTTGSTQSQPGNSSRTT